VVCVSGWGGLVKQIPRGNDRKKGKGRNKYRGFWLKASSGLAGPDGVAGPSAAVRMRPRTFAQDDGVGVGEEKRARTEVRAHVYLLVAVIVRAKARTYLRDKSKSVKQIPKGNDRKKSKSNSKCGGPSLCSG